MSRFKQTDQDPLFGESQTPPWGRWVLGVAILVLLGFVVYAAINGAQKGPEGPLPVIRADETPWTRVPDDKGGMEIPNTDSTVFNLAEGTELPPPSLDDVMDQALGMVESAKDAPQIPAVDKPEDKVVAKVVGMPEDKSVQKPAEKPVDPIVEKPVDVAGDTVSVRLGSIPGSDMAAAKREFVRVQSKADGLLAGVTASFEQVDLPAKGKFIRVNAAVSPATAKRLCDVLSGKGMPCLVMKP